MKRVLIIGATGVFGQRLAAHLARFDDIELIVTSRSAAKAEVLARELSGRGTAKAVITPMALDHRKALAATLAAIKPFVVIDCSGPFQGAGYDVPRAALEAGAHCLDLADARDYIIGYEQELDSRAVERGLTALAGASSSPAISRAALDAMTVGWQRIDTVDMAIRPAGRTEVGEAAFGAVLSYAGKPVPVWREGEEQTSIGWASLQTMAAGAMGPACHGHLAQMGLDRRHIGIDPLAPASPQTQQHCHRPEGRYGRARHRS
jgi:saccharopine dehydrogenase-like NADP-dependent oxidoreductase